MLKTSITVILMLVSSTVWSHSFDLGLILPISGSKSEAGQQVLDGFLLATTEEDAHPDETSDGHLGGLDSHVLKVDSGVGPTAMLKSLAALMQQREPIFVTGLFSGDMARLTAQSLKSENTVFFDPAESAMWQIILTNPDALKLMSGGSFSTRFHSRYGYYPTLDAMRGYTAARLIAATVRSLSEDDLNSPRKLAATLARIQRELQ